MVEYRIDQEELEHVLPILMRHNRSDIELELINSFAKTIRDLALFLQDLTIHQQLELARFYQLETHDDKRIIFHKGDASLCLYVILKGSLEVFNELEHELEHVAYIGAGKMIGERGLARNLPRSLSAVTRGKTVLLTLEKDKFKRYMLDHIHVSLMEKVSFIQRYLPGLSSYTKSHKERLAYSLNTLWFRRGEVIVEEGNITDQLYFIADGECTLSKFNAMSKVVISKLGEGSVIGDESIFFIQPVMYTVTVFRDVVKIYRLSRHDMNIHIPEKTIEILKHNCRIKLQGRHLLQQRLSPVTSPRSAEVSTTDRFMKAAPGARKRIIQVEERMFLKGQRTLSPISDSSNNYHFKQILESLRLDTGARLKKSCEDIQVRKVRRQSSTILPYRSRKFIHRKSSIPSIL
jgi:CRP-like cAMP-binding protein